jgi:hypothetical protein
MEIVIWVIAGIVLGAAGGAAFTYWWTRARGGGDTIGQLKRENQKFREEVTEHFVETGRLINQLTDSYKEVFDHLNKGATELADEKALADRLPASDRDEVRLKRLGASTASSDRDSNDSGSKKRGDDESERKHSAGSGRTEKQDTPEGGRAKAGGNVGEGRGRAGNEDDPRREFDKRSDGADPLKRGGASSSGTSSDSSSGDNADEASGSGSSTGSEAKSDSGSASKSGSGPNSKSDEAKTTGGSGGSGGDDPGKSAGDDKNGGSKASGS